MLPWLVIPLIGLWAMSQLLPPAFRFEITSPRLACVMVLLVTLFWYEILMPQLSAWRAKRNALLRERMRFEAMEMQKLRKTATRKCRNCLTAYRDQNPCGGKFMCLFCGHISKRPVLDMPVAAEAGNSGILKDLIGKSGKILNAKAWSENGWMCGHDWLDGNGGNNWRKNCGDSFGYEEDGCLTKKSYPRSFVFACKLLAAVSSCLMWLFRKVSRGSSAKEDDALTDTDHRGLLESRGGANVGNIQESRGERARRKAEEKRLARLEKEQLEEEERKQREDVARLVEERRKLRDEKLEAEKECPKEGPPSIAAKETDSRKESERRRHERKREKDRGSSKSNSDVEELEKRAAGKEGSDRAKRTENDSKRDRAKVQISEHGYGVNRGNAGTRYLDRMRGTFLSSSRAFTRGGFFGKSTNSPVVSREHKPLENSQSSSTFRKDIATTTPVRSGHCEDHKMVNSSQRSAGAQSFTASNQSWIRLFPQSSSPAPPPPPLSSDSNRKSPEKLEYSSASGVPDSSIRPAGLISNVPASGPSLNHHPPPPPPVPFGSPSSSNSLQPVESFIPKHQFLPEDSEIFEDPCYVPDPISLLGPVSESLDNFQLDVISSAPPIESPLSRSSRVSVARNPNPFLLFPQKSDGGSSIDPWKMWNSSSNCSSNMTSSSPPSTSPMNPIGGPAVSWIFHPETKKEGLLVHPSPVKTMASLFENEDDGSAVDGSPWLLPRYGEVVPPPSSSSSSAGNSWANRQEGGSARDGVVSPIGRPHIGGLYSTPDVQSMWRFD